jgi:hypothetical protein
VRHRSVKLGVSFRGLEQVCLGTMTVDLLSSADNNRPHFVNLQIGPRRLTLLLMKQLTPNSSNTSSANNL